MKLENFDEFQNQMHITPGSVTKHLTDKLNSFNKELQNIRFKKNDIHDECLAHYKQVYPGRTEIDLMFIDTPERQEYRQRTQKIEDRIRVLNANIKNIERQLGTD